MDWKTECKTLISIIVVTLTCLWMPVGDTRFDNALLEALQLVRWYARTHVLSSLVPALFIAGAIATFVNKASLKRYLEVRARQVWAYSVASISGAVLPVCSCMVLPLFAGISRMGAGLGPACTFLYSGPAINVLAIILTARILGPQLGIARAVAAIVFSIVIGLTMHLIYRKKEQEEVKMAMPINWPETRVTRPLWKTAIFVASLMAVAALVNWTRSGKVQAVLLCCPDGLTAYEIKGDLVERTDTAVTVRDITGIVHEISTDVLQEIRLVPRATIFKALHALRWSILLLALACTVWMLGAWFERSELNQWVEESWGYAKRILPILFVGILISGFMLGRPGHDGVIPGRYIEMLVGTKPDAFLQVMGWAGNSLEKVIRSLWPVWTNFFASVLGVFIYFSTLTEIPIVQGLLGAGMGKGPALALLLTGPIVSLPSMLVIRSIMGTRKALIFTSLVVLTATGSGMAFGCFF